jgi:2-polyprenyl-6-methoxyphenol hydroxylase-like FAD-dependent oxidoreductase
MTSVVIAGGGLTGMLCAAAVSRFADSVTVVESDKYPDSPRPRRGVPHGMQNHMLMAGGAEAIDQLLPGTTALLYAAGAHRLAMGTGIATLSSEGWFRRTGTPAYVIACSRALIDHVVRSRVASDAAPRVLESTKAVGLTGDAARVTGVVVERDGERWAIPADFVVETMGDRSKSAEWLTGFGLPEAQEERVDPKLAYAGRLYEAPRKANDNFPGVLIQAQPGTGRPGQGAAFMPQEDGKWIVSLVGTGGGQPPTDEEGFSAFARNLRSPVIADLIALARPLTPIRGSRGLANRRRRFDRLPLPEGFVALGDAAMVLSPNYATGMSIAAQSALVLRTQLKKSGWNPALGALVQAEAAKMASGSWKMASSTDSQFPGVDANVAIDGGAMQQRMVSRFSRVAAENATVMSAIYEVASLRDTQAGMMTPKIMAMVMRGPKLPPLSDEQALGQFPEIRDLLSGTPTQIR